MSIERGQAVILVVGGMLVGSGVTTLVLKKYYQKIADEEIASVKAAYKEKEQSFYKSGVTQEDVDKANVIVTEVPDIEITMPDPEGPSFTPYNKIDPSPEAKAEFDRIVENHQYAQRPADPAPVEVPRVPMDLTTPNPDAPYIITVDQFMGNEEEFDQITLTYYSGDGQLVDDMEKLVDDVDGSIGLNNLRQFGDRSGNDDTVYVRNVEREADFEIIRDYRSFGKDMMGIDEEPPSVRIKPPKPPKAQKFRGE